LKRSIENAKYLAETLPKGAAGEADKTLDNYLATVNNEGATLKSHKPAEPDVTGKSTTAYDDDLKDTQGHVEELEQKVLDKLAAQSGSAQKQYDTIKELSLGLYTLGVILGLIGQLLGSETGDVG
jgi:hypothetical protein